VYSTVPRSLNGYSETVPFVGLRLCRNIFVQICLPFRASSCTTATKIQQYAVDFDAREQCWGCLMLLVKKGNSLSITERRVPQLIPVLGSQPAGDVSHKPGGRLPILSAGPAVTLATLKTAATNFAAW